MPHRLNLAKRPFVDARPVNLVIGLLLATVLVLGFVSYRTVARYLVESSRTREAIAQLKAESARLDVETAAQEAALDQIDVASLAESARDVRELARLASFSWTRFFTRLEKTLPADSRVVRVALAREDRQVAGKGLTERSYRLDLTVLSRDPEGLPKAIRAFYASPYFDRPVPLAEEGPAAGAPEGWRQVVSVEYKDAVPDQPNDVVPQARNPVALAATGAPFAAPPPAVPATSGAGPTSVQPLGASLPSGPSATVKKKAGPSTGRTP